MIPRDFEKDVGIFSALLTDDEHALAAEKVIKREKNETKVVSTSRARRVGLIPLQMERIWRPSGENSSAETVAVMVEGQPNDDQVCGSAPIQRRLMFTPIYLRLTTLGAVTLFPILYPSLAFKSCQALVAGCGERLSSMMP